MGDDGQLKPCGEGEGEEERLWGLLVKTHNV